MFIWLWAGSLVCTFQYATLNWLHACININTNNRWWKRTRTRVIACFNSVLPSMLHFRICMALDNFILLNINIYRYKIMRWMECNNNINSNINQSYIQTGIWIFSWNKYARTDIVSTEIWIINAYMRIHMSHSPSSIKFTHILFYRRSFTHIHRRASANIFIKNWTTKIYENSIKLSR